MMVRYSPVIMNNLKSPRGTNPAVTAPDTSTFDRPAWVPRPSSLSDSTPRVTTAELRRPVFSRDSMPQVSTGDLQRPTWASRRQGAA